MVRLARRNVPEGEFVCSDVMSAEFEDENFDAVAAFYSIFHLPREDHRRLFERIYRWLRPDGYFLCTMTGRNEEAHVEDDFFGVTMFWSDYRLEEHLRMLRAVGFELLEVGVTGSGWGDWVDAGAEEHPLVLGRTRSWEIGRGQYPIAL